MNDGGPAFPKPWSHGPIDGSTREWSEAKAGMSLRDWFAGMALQGVRLQADGPIQDCEALREAAKQVAIGAYAIADAMLEACQEPPAAH